MADLVQAEHFTMLYSGFISFSLKLWTVHFMFYCLYAVGMQRESLYTMLETVIKLHPKLYVFLTQFLTPYSVFSCLAQIHDTYSNSAGMKAVTNVIWRVGGGIVLFPWLWVVVGVVSKRVREKMTKCITNL